MVHNSLRCRYFFLSEDAAQLDISGRCCCKETIAENRKKD